MHALVPSAIRLSVNKGISDRLQWPIQRHISQNWGSNGMDPQCDPDHKFFLHKLSIGTLQRFHWYITGAYLAGIGI